ncbi:MAG: 2-succinyl-6-hydroxy-2,4-cyclohexadiene-carboxylate synthase [Thermoleophilaceae bacterium]|nr:2-succinyl-6-hydroxy-2,4-cyclohexadiene-carboxylate synthase [Thermoleophilaceae bacterium]
MIFVPGFMQKGDAWSPVGELVGQRYPSAYLDFRTHSFEARLGELRQAAQPGAVVVGYSMGGRLALHLAVREPDRLAGLVTVGASPGIDDPEERRRRAEDDARLAAWMEQSTIEEVVARWEGLPVFADQPAELVEAQRRGRLEHDPRLLATLLRSAGQGVLPGIWDELRRIRAPVLALAGERDKRYIAAARRIALLAPRGDALPVMGAGHAAHLERPDVVASLVLEFLDQHFGQGGVVD